MGLKDNVFDYFVKVKSKTTHNSVKSVWRKKGKWDVLEIVYIYYFIKIDIFLNIGSMGNELVFFPRYSLSKSVESDFD